MGMFELKVRKTLGGWEVSNNKSGKELKFASPADCNNESIFFCC